MIYIYIQFINLIYDPAVASWYLEQDLRGMQSWPFMDETMSRSWPATFRMSEMIGSPLLLEANTRSMGISGS